MKTTEMNSSLQELGEKWGQGPLASYVIQMLGDHYIQGVPLGNYVFSGSEQITEDNPFISKKIEAEFFALEEAGIEALTFLEQE